MSHGSPLLYVVLCLDRPSQPNLWIRQGTGFRTTPIDRSGTDRLWFMRWIQDMPDLAGRLDRRNGPPHWQRKKNSTWSFIFGIFRYATSTTFSAVVPRVPNASGGPLPLA